MKGLTLIELMAAVAILTIILSVAVPNTSYLLEKYQADIAISNLKSILMRSRGLALEQEIAVTICPIQNNQCSQSWNDTITAFSDNNNNQVIDQEEHIFFSTQMSASSGSWQKKRINTPYMKFSPQGHAFSTATTFLFCPYSENTRLAQQLVINFQGRIRVNNYLSSNGTPYASISPLDCS